MTASHLQPVASYLFLELTTRCNLRCVYCARSQPGFKGRDLPFDGSGLVERLERAGIREVQLNGHGESTIVCGWRDLALALSTAGIALDLTTNMARRMDAADVSALNRFRCIAVSCDTCDPALFARLRPPARLESVAQNLRALRASGAPRGAARPHVSINCTLVDRVVEGLPDLVRWAAARDVDAVSLVNLVEYPSVDPSFPIRHPADVDPRATLARIREARELAADLGLEFHVMDGLYARLQEALEP